MMLRFKEPVFVLVGFAFPRRIESALDALLVSGRSCLAMGRIVTKGACCWWEASESERRSVRLVANRRQRRAALEVQTISIVNSTKAATRAGQGDSQRLPELGDAPRLCFQHLCVCCRRGETR